MGGFLLAEFNKVSLTAAGRMRGEADWVRHGTNTTMSHISGRGMGC